MRRSSPLLISWIVARKGTALYSGENSRCLLQQQHAVRPTKDMKHTCKVGHWQDVWLVVEKPTKGFSCCSIKY